MLDILITVVCYKVTRNCVHFLEKSSEVCLLVITRLHFDCNYVCTVIISISHYNMAIYHPYTVRVIILPIRNIIICQGGINAKKKK